ncbi:cobalt-zinc-cadmium efflux system outer membrane protein [Stenotrophomonas sp. AN71]|uniref:TolC family protein n=1 Tax=Stenotrophomonas sp. AN71 TaxID=3156253 RepID=UPI003D1CBA4B
MKRLHPALMTLALLLPASGTVAAADDLPSSGIVRLAVQGHPQLLAARAEHEASGHGAEAVQRGPYEFQASVTPQQRRTEADGNFNEWEAQLGRSVRLPGKARLDQQIATQMRDVADRTQRGVQLAVGESLLDSWMRWLDAEQVLRLTEAQQQLLARERDAARQMHDKGALSTLDLDLIDADLASAAARLIGAQADAAQARQRLRRQFPQLPLPERAPQVAEPQPLPADHTALSAHLIDTSAALAVARGKATEQSLLADRARAERRPDPTVGVRWLREGRDPENALGLVISVPFSGGYRRAQAQQAAAQEAASHAHAQGIEREVQLEVWNALHQGQALQDRWRAERNALTAHRSAAERSRRAWELGELGMSQYLLAERALLDRQLAEQQARTQAATAVRMLQLRAGQLWSDALLP